MKNLFIPTWYATSINEIDFEVLKKAGIDTILCDLDNTLVAFNQLTPLPSTLEFIEMVRSLGFKFYIISNNHEDRVAKFCQNLDVIYLHTTHKPLTGRLKKFISQQKIDATKMVIIGDQLLNDILLSNSMQLHSILVEPVVDKDLLITKFNRFIDKRIRKYNLKHNNYQTFKKRCDING